MGDVVSFTRDTMITARQAFIDSLIALGARDGADMTLDRLVLLTRETAWREAVGIAEFCCDMAWCPVEQETFPLVETVHPGVRQTLVDAAALVVACDRLLDEWTTIRRHNPTQPRPAS